MQGIEQFQPARLKSARLMYDGLSRAALAEMINVAPSTLKKWEDGTHFPQHEALEKLSDSLQIPYHWFLKPMIDQGNPLFLNRAKKSILKAPCDRSNEMLLNLSEIREIAEEWINFPNVNLIRSLTRSEALLLTNSEIEELAFNLRQLWGLGKSPITDLTKRIEKAGIVVTRFEIGYDEMDGTSAWIRDKPYIFIASDKNNYFRSRFDIAHELGHLIMHRNLSHEDKKARFNLLEEQAHYFASCFIFPPDAFTAEAHRMSIESLTMLKKRWGLSIAAMIYKASSLRMISEEQASRLWRSLRYRGYHKSEPYDNETPPENPVALKNAIKLMLSEGGFSKSNIVDQFGLKKHLELLCNLPSGFLNEDFGQIISMKKVVFESNQSGNVDTLKTPGEIIKFSS